MRWWLALLLVIPMAQAVQWEDPAGDQEYGRTLAITDQGREEHWETVGAYGWYPQADVLAASIKETGTHLIFDVTLAAIDNDPLTEAPPSLDHPTTWLYEWSFEFKGEQLVAGFERYGDDPDDVWFAILQREVRPGYVSIHYRAVWSAESKSDEPGYRAVVPKFIIRDSDQVPIREGDRLEGLRFSSRDGAYFRSDLVPCPNTNPQRPLEVIIGSDCGWRVRDLLQGGEELGDFEVKLTPPGVGHVFMRVDDPVRLSNGLATTYLFEAKVHNLGDAPDDLLVQVTNIPAKWEVHMPTVVSFSGKGDQTIPIAVTVPFEHQHGVEHFMELTVVSERDPTAAAKAMFGVVYADPAQPGGHHDTLYFHTSPDNGYWGWMNTAQDDGKGAKDTISAWSSEFIPNEQFAWEIWLSPNLDMGLDFDMSGVGELVFDLQTPTQFDGVVEASLELWDWKEDTRTPLVRGSTEASISGAPTTIRIDLAPEAAADLIESRPGTNLVLRINATSAMPGVPMTSRVQETAQFLTQDASMRLPLIDYHDVVDLTGLHVAAFDMEALNDTHRSVNPGRTAAVAFNVSNLLDAPATIDWELKGAAPFTDWATLGTPTTYLRPSGNGTVVVRYQPPATATEEDIAEFVLIGRARADENQQVFARIAFFVETDKDIPDESAWAAGLEGDAEKANALANKESPGLPLLLLLAVIFFARRHR